MSDSQDSQYTQSQSSLSGDSLSQSSSPDYKEFLLYDSLASSDSDDSSYYPSQSSGSQSQSQSSQSSQSQ